MLFAEVVYLILAILQETSQLTPVGCDGIVGSSRTEDSCGVCGGTGLSCRLISGLFTTPTLSAGYNYITTIPVNASNISISQIKKDTRNYLALRRRDGSYIINGMKGISSPGIYRVASTSIVYQNGLNGKEEKIMIHDPIPEPLDLMIIYQEPNSGVKYEYRIPTTGENASLKLGTFVNGNLNSTFSDNSSIYFARQGKASYSYDKENHKKLAEEHPKNKIRAKKRKFIWKFTGYTSCSKTCGGGVQIPQFKCVRESNEAVGPEKKCASAETPAISNKPCNNKPCPARWMTGDWGSCSGSCGQGVQYREVHCKQELADSEIITVNPRNCFYLTQPPMKKPCFLGTCSHQTALGTANEWLASPWSQCSEECGKGIQTRRVICLGKDCDTSKQPEERRPCSTDRKCMGQWFTGPWQKCSGTCGTGQQTRTIICVAQVLGEKIITNDENCQPSEKPVSQEVCQLAPCTPTWFVAEWNECSKSCDSGIKKREVRCLSEELLPSITCNETEKPAVHHICNTTPCLLNDDDCVDKLHNCPTVVQARLCSYNYYNRFCCMSCRKRM